jgi:hypothetical protein
MFSLRRAAQAALFSGSNFAEPRSSRSYLPFAARFEAFKGFTAAESPENPRRSLGGFFAFVITT